MKQCMRQADAVYGGEMSGHHYFRNFAYCDSGMIPVDRDGAAPVADRQAAVVARGRAHQLFPSSGEINRQIGDVSGAVDAVRQRYQPGSVKIENVDGLSIEHPRWRFNLRSSNTEPLLRLNVESRGEPALMQEKRDELLELLETFARQLTRLG